MREFKEPSRDSTHNPSFKEFFDNCLASGEHPLEYSKKNGINMNNGAFFAGLRDWSKETTGTRTHEEDMLLYKITQASNNCCHADCGGPTCSRAMFNEMLEGKLETPEENIEMLSEVIKSKSVFDFSKPRIIEDLISEIFKNELSSENKTRTIKELDSIQRYIAHGKNHKNPYVLRDLEKLEKTITEFENKLK